MSNDAENSPSLREIVTNPNTVDTSRETVPVKSRFVIFGSRISGAYGAADAFEKYLATHGFEDTQVDTVRNAAFIDDVFYNTPQEDASREVPTSKPASILRRLGHALLRREVASAQDGVGKDLPLGVVVFPEMRQYTPSGSGMFIPSPREYIRDLCDKNRVPVIFMEDVHTAAELAGAISSFALEPGQVTQE